MVGTRTVDLVVALMIAGVALFAAWRLTACAFPLDQRLPEDVERSLPLQGKWLRAAVRGLVLPIVFFALFGGGLALHPMIVSIVLKIGALFTL